MKSLAVSPLRRGSSIFVGLCSGALCSGHLSTGATDTWTDLGSTSVSAVRIVLRSLFSFVQLIVAVVFGGAALAFTLAALAPSLADIWGARTTVSAHVDLSILEQTTVVYDMNGEIIAELKGEIDREYVALTEMSPEIIETVLAVEDAKFYTHKGINVAAITRAAVTNVSAGGVEQGGSTITQQLVKLGVLNSEQSLDRKLPEAAIAMRLEGQMTKEEILERYLNAAYFAGGAYGVQAAAETYFNKDAIDLNYGESALLAGIISNPRLYDPVYRPANALDRRSTALGRLLAEGFIDEEERAVWEESEMPRYRQADGDQFLHTYFVEEVRRQLLDDPLLGATRGDRLDLVLRGGLEVHTTFDPVAQALAENAVASEFPDNNLGIIAGLVSLEPGTGAIRAMIGGPGFDKFEFNVVTQKGRPTGSSFKPFVLAAAFETGGLIPADTINATSPCEFANPGSDPPVYKAGDYNGSRRSGALSIQDHTLRSTNCGFLRLSQIVGLNNVVDTTHALGVTAEVEPVLSLPLGVFDITPLEMANAYATFANDGIRVEPHVISRVMQGDKVISQNDPKPFRAIRPQTARLVTDILEKNVNCSAGACTGRRARLDEHPAAGKTGTGQSNYDAWFVGYTPQLATAVWLGGQEGQIAMRYDRRNPDHIALDYERAFGEFAYSGVTGGSLPAMVWGRFMNDYMAGLPVVEFLEPEPGRRGERVSPDPEFEEPEFVRVSPCGSENAEVDQDGDGDIDWCRNLGGVDIDEELGCPGLLVAVDRDGDGVKERCIARIRPDGAIDPNTTTTTDPNAPTTTVTGETTVPPATTAAPTATAAPTTTVAP